MVRGITGIGNKKGPFINLHDVRLAVHLAIFLVPHFQAQGFQGQNNWAGFLAGADRVSLDTHKFV
jgi:hypothetical protein